MKRALLTAAWVFVGALWAFSVLAMMTIGIFVVPFAIAGTLLLQFPAARAARPNASAVVGPLFVGLSLPLLYVAWLNRQGPGDICTTIRNGESCTEEMSPWPWIAIAVALIVTGLVVMRRRQLRSRIG